MTDSPQPPEPVLSHAELSALRLRILAGEEPSIEEMQAVVQTTRALHAKAITPKEKPASKVKKETIAAKAKQVDLGDLLTGDL